MWRFLETNSISLKSNSKVWIVDAYKNASFYETDMLWDKQKRESYVASAEAMLRLAHTIQFSELVSYYSNSRKLPTRIKIPMIRNKMPGK